MVGCSGGGACGGVMGAGPGIGVDPLFPRRIDLHRSRQQNAPAAVGAGNYGGREASTALSDPEGEMILLQNLPCQIESRGIGRATGQMTLAGNVTRNPQWRIMTKPLPLGTIRDNDIIVDDEGYRYQVALNNWTINGYVLDCIRLET